MTPEQVETVVRGIMDNFPEASESLACIGWNYSTLEFEFWESDGDKNPLKTNRQMLLDTFPLIRSEKWPKGCTPAPALDTPEAWGEWLCQADATDFDAFLQLAVFKEVIYG